ncbi:unnamed protein product [Owenia fusiformis]|uniref:G-protein coupled receptors family 1 profile domain-containing protein n=1 Tax=Owenia fusiformis TaxID=6347 RepID=A0A8S4NUI3_OWEFU|nr:unnamed protein product [Owenia fusiformis]
MMMNKSVTVINYAELSGTAITQIVIEAIMSILGLAGNLIIIVLILRTKRLRRVTNYFIVSLCFVGLIIASFVIPIHILAEFEIDNQDFCLAAYTLILIFCMCSVLTLLAIATERYSAIVTPFSYLKWFTPGRVLASIVIIWLTSLLTAIYPIVAHKTQTKDPNNTLCSFQNAVPKEGGIPCFWVMFVCIIITSAMYIKIMAVARRQSRRIAALDVTDYTEKRPTTNIENAAAIFHTSESVMDLDTSASIPGIYNRVKRVSYNEPGAADFGFHNEARCSISIQMKELTPRKYDKSTNTDNNYLNNIPKETAIEYLRMIEIYNRELQRKQSDKDHAFISEDKTDEKNVRKCSEVQKRVIDKDIETNGTYSAVAEVHFMKGEDDCRMNKVYSDQSDDAVVEPFNADICPSKPEIENSMKSNENGKRIRKDHTFQNVSLKKRTASKRNSASSDGHFEDALKRARQRNNNALTDVEALYSISQLNEESNVRSYSHPHEAGADDTNHCVPVIGKLELDSPEIEITLPALGKENDYTTCIPKQGKWFQRSSREEVSEEPYVFDDDVTLSKNVLPKTKKECLNVPGKEFPRHGPSVISSGSRLHSICEISANELEHSIRSTSNTRRRSNNETSGQQQEALKLRRSTLKRSLSMRERLVESFHNFQERRRSKSRMKELKRGRRERRTTLFLGVVILYFFVAYTPLLVTLSLFYYGIKPFNAITVLAYLLIFTSCVANPFIYGFGYREYRKSLQNMLCKSRDRLVSRVSSSD